MDTFSPQDYLRLALTSQIYDIARKTPLDKMENLSTHLKNNIFLKREDTQVVHSFKIRGAYSMLLHLTPDERKKGIVAASAGNHAQGVALGAKHLGIDALIVMPEQTPSIKVDAVRGFGAQILLFGNNFNEAMDKALSIAQEQQRIFIPAFDHPFIIAGQGTIGLELIQQARTIDKIFVPVGGGGLIAGISTIVKQLNPKIKVIGVESKDSACLKAALDANKLIKLKHVGLFADGLAVKQVGDEPFRLCKEFVDEVITVNEDEICIALKDIFDDVRAIAEPSGAVALAGAKQYIATHNIHHENLITIVSGANINFHRLRYVSERCELNEHHEALFSINIPEQKGSFLKFYESLAKHNITELSYRYINANTSAHIFMRVQIRDNAEKDDLITALEAKSYKVYDMSYENVVKTHIRYMMGGRATQHNEELYQIIFPEEPGSLGKFLGAIGDKWNISLFHYRNQADDYGDILIAFQVNPEEVSKLEAEFDKLNYHYTKVSDSLGYQNFLQD